MILVAIVFAVYAWGGAHEQQWNCLGPQPALTGACVTKHLPGWPDERR